MTYRVLDLFSGIGGFTLGLERTGGFKTVAFCEIEPFCQRVLAKHWPWVPCYHDVRTLTAERLAADGISVDVICGGFPCQDISLAGKGAGLEGERSGLWSEIARLSGELRPRYVIVENVAGLLGRGLDKVLGDLAALGFDAEWHCIPASAVGAPHRRDRLWLVAYAVITERRPRATSCRRVEGALSVLQGQEGPSRSWASGQDVADAHSQRKLQPEGRKQDERGWISNGCEDMADADGAGLSERRQAGKSEGQGQAIWQMAFAQSERCGRAWWTSEPDVGRVANGVPSRVDRLRALGNAVVPQIPELIGHAILAAEGRGENGDMVSFCPPR